jgi:hypothetical protein
MLVALSDRRPVPACPQNALGARQDSTAMAAHPADTVSRFPAETGRTFLPGLIQMVRNELSSFT